MKGQTWTRKKIIAQRDGRVAALRRRRRRRPNQKTRRRPPALPGQPPARAPERPRMFHWRKKFTQSRCVLPQIVFLIGPLKRSSPTGKTKPCRKKEYERRKKTCSLLFFAYGPKKVPPTVFAYGEIVRRTKKLGRQAAPCAYASTFLTPFPFSRYFGAGTLFSTTFKTLV